VCNHVLYNLTLNFAEGTMKKACCGVVAWVALLSVFVAPTRAAPPLLPDPHLTPGDVLTTDPTVICVSGYTATVRNVSQSVKNQVYKAYGIISHQPRE
jgi:hypothetical protein